MLDVTIIYEGPAEHALGVSLRTCRAVVVDVRERGVPRDLISRDYNEDDRFRDQVQAWVRELWAEKDAFIDTVVTEDRRVPLAEAS